MRSVVLLVLFVSSAFSQIQWPPKWDSFKFTFEARAREEARTGVNFGQDPQGPRSGTFDQLYATNHDKFGHADLFGWRNIHNLRSLDTLHLAKGLALNFMYDNFWLASARDALYNGQGRPIVRAARGDAGTHVGQELDWFATYSRSGFQFGAGFAHLFAGEFLKKTTPGVNTRYLYLSVLFLLIFFCYCPAGCG